jgi:hypothetical protein
MGWTAECITSYGVVVGNDDKFPARMAALQAEAFCYERKVTTNWIGDRRYAKVRKRRFEPLKKAGEVFVFAYVSEGICDEGRHGTMPSRYYSPSYSNSCGESQYVEKRMDEDERNLHRLVLEHFPEGRLATFTTTMSAEVHYPW